MSDEQQGAMSSTSGRATPRPGGADHAASDHAASDQTQITEVILCEEHRGSAGHAVVLVEAELCERCHPPVEPGA